MRTHRPKTSGILAAIAIVMLLQVASLASAAPCVSLGKLCTPQTGPCCSGLVCPPDGPQKNHCVVDTNPTLPPPTTPPATEPPSNCSHVNGMCSATHACCAGLACTNGSCKSDAGTTPTTAPPVTTTTHPSVTTTTIPLPATSGGAKSGPYRWSFGDVGLHWTSDSQEMMWNHQTGGRLDQAGCWAMSQFLRFVVEPSILAAARDVPSCAQVYAGMTGLPDTTTSKFLFDYVSRPLHVGGQYNCHGNYEWDLTQNDLIEPFCGHGNGRQQGCLYRATNPTENAAWLAAHPTFGPLCDLRVEGGQIVPGDLTYTPHPHCAWFDLLCKYSSAHLQDGALDPHPAQPDVPFSAAECSALAAAHTAHNVTHAGTQGAQLEFERIACATSPRHCTLATMLFVGPTNALHSPADAARYEQEVNDTHTRWSEAFNCGTGKPADLYGVVLGLFAHCRTHNLRYEPPGNRLREICLAALMDGTVACPRTAN